MCNPLLIPPTQMQTFLPVYDAVAAAAADVVDVAVDVVGAVHSCIQKDKHPLKKKNHLKK